MIGVFCGCMQGPEGNVNARTVCMSYGWMSFNVHRSFPYVERLLWLMSGHSLDLSISFFFF